MQINMKDYNLECFKEKDLWQWDEIIGKIEDLISDKRIIEKELEDLKQDLESNYKPITVAEQYDI